MLKKLLSMLLLTASTVYAMHDFELNLNNKDIDLHLNLDMGQFNHQIEPDNVFIQARLMKGDNDHACLFNTQDPNLLTEVGFVVQSTSAMSPGLTMGMGIKTVYTPLNEKAILAVPIGVLVDYALPLDLPITFHIGGRFYYSPEVLAFESSTSYMEYQANFDIQLMERGFLTTGYRGIDTPTIEQSNTYYNRSYFVGVRFLF